MPKPQSGDIKRPVAQTSLDHGMTHVQMAPDERIRRLASGVDLHASERYDGAHPCSDVNISVASLKSTRRGTGSHCNSCRTGEMLTATSPRD